MNNKGKSWGVAMIETPTPGGTQAMLAMPLRKLPAYLYSIDPRKVKPESREKVERYQAECDDVLWQYWSEGHVSQSSNTAQLAGFIIPDLDKPLTLDQVHACKALLNTATKKLGKAKVDITVEELEKYEKTRKKQQYNLICDMVRCGMTRDQISDELGITRNHVRQIIFHAKRKCDLTAAEGLV